VSERPIRALFVTYAFVKQTEDFVPAPSPARPWPARIGVLKRFLRLVEHLPADAIEVHWVHYGGLDPSDPLIRRVVPGLRRYDGDGARYELARFGRRPTPLSERIRRIRYMLNHLVTRLRGRLPATVDAIVDEIVDEAPGVEAFLERLQPDVVVLAEQPISGRMRVVSRIAHRLGLLQVVINDMYPDEVKERLLRDEPQVAGWFLLGLRPSGEPDRFGSRMVIGPPLLAQAGRPRDGADVTILGYDPLVAVQGIRFLRRCPPGTVGRLVVPALGRRQRRAWAREAAGTDLRFTPLPDECQYRAMLAGSRVVFGKNGFQQIAETLAVGTPMIAWEVDGGVPDFGIDAALRPFVSFLTPAPETWDTALSATRQWLDVRPAMPWVEEFGTLPCPARHGAELFAAFLRDVVAAHHGAAAR